MSKTACWTCKDRKIRCDGSHPVCTNCVRSRRQCQGYGMRLSWPQEQDSRRSLQGPEPPASMGARHAKTVRWVNAGFQDIELYHHLTAAPLFADVKSNFLLPTLTDSITWTPSRLDEAEYSLLQYFESIALHALTTCDDDPLKFLGDLSRLALTDATDSSTAVLQALLAVASVHRHGIQAEAVRLQGAALRALESSAQRGMSDSEAVQHIAAGMLLCSFEVQGISHTSGPWLWYVGGARRLIQAIDPRKETLPSEFFTMLNWVHYHYVMARFSLRHWHPTQRSAPWELSHPLGPTVSKIARITGVSSCSLTLLGPVSEVFENLIAPSDARYHSEEYRNYLASLEGRLNTIGTSSDHSSITPLPLGEFEVARGGSTFHLFRLAALVYLERASNNFSGQSPKIDAWTDLAFRIINTIRACKQAFPLLIFGCEARTDQRRIAILDAIEQTAKKTHSRNLQSVLQVLQSVWNQDDLEVKRDVDYNLKLSVILSASDTVPSFA